MIKRDTLLSILTFSEKRKDILFFLQESPKTLSKIKDFVGVKKTSEIMPRIKELKEANMIEVLDGKYQLTPFAEAALVDYKPFLDTLTAIETNESFWKDHDTSGIPRELLHRIKELKTCKIITAEAHNINESHPEFVENVANSLTIRGITRHLPFGHVLNICGGYPVFWHIPDNNRSHLSHLFAEGINPSETSFPRGQTRTSVRFCFFI